MRQRAMIALALACRPKVLLADEPTTALDATVQIQILLLLRELQRDLGLSIIFVTHDIGAAVEVADRIAVMYAGRIVEEGTARQLIRTPRHPYTIGLLQSRAEGALAKGTRLEAIPGAPPDLATRRPAAPSPPLLPGRGALRGGPAGRRDRARPPRRLLADGRRGPHRTRSRRGRRAGLSGGIRAGLTAALARHRRTGVRPSRLAAAGTSG